MIQFDLDRCVGCGLCVSDCFPGAISMKQEKAALAASESCIACGHCIAICPCAAVSDGSLSPQDIHPLQMNVNAQELLGLMRSRRSCRHYTDRFVDEASKAALLEAARACPTAKNLQSTRYIFVEKAIPVLLDGALRALEKVGQHQLHSATDPSELRRAKNFLAWTEKRKQDKTFDPLFFHAPLLMLFVTDQPDARDAAAAASYTELMAAALGLGCLYSGYFTACAAGSSEIQQLLGLAPGEQIARCLVLGYPDVKFQRTAPRKQPNVTCM